MNVLALQTKLKSAGQDPGPLDGMWGGRTCHALAAHINGAPIPDGVGAALNKYMSPGGITSRLRILHFLAQIAHESGFKPVEENLNYKTAAAMMKAWPSRFPTPVSCSPFLRNPEALANRVYAGRMGNAQPGDGWLFRGRGLIQNTGRDGYIAVGLEDCPDAALSIDGSAKAAVAFWNWKKINPLADADDIVGVTKKVNGGTNGLPDRTNKLARGKTIWPAV